MLIDKQIHMDEDDTVGWIESIYESSNILMTTYFPKTNKLYISFNRGGVYSYGNINEEMFNEFENAESQGKFFTKNIRNKNEHPYFKEYTLLGGEIDRAKQIIKEHKESQEDE
jgi:hypothetical protein